MLSNEELAYLAGIIDGEGSISLVRRKQQHHPVQNRNSRSDGNPHPGVSVRLMLSVMVGMTDGVIPNWLYEEFGGSLSYRVNGNPNWKDRWDWTACSQIGSNFLKAILPYLVVKQRRAELAIQFQDARVPGKRLSAEQRLSDETIYEEMSKLNSRGKGEQLMRNKHGTNPTAVIV